MSPGHESEEEEEGNDVSAVWGVVLLELDNRGAAPFANKQLYRHEQFSTISCMPRSLRKSSSKGFFQSAKKADVDCGILPPTGTIFAMNSDQSNVKRRQKQVDKLHKAKIKGDPNIGVSTEAAGQLRGGNRRVPQTPMRKKKERERGCSKRARSRMMSRQLLSRQRR